MNTIPCLPAWASGPNGLTAWCADCRRFHHLEPEFDAVPGHPRMMWAPTCKAAPLGVFAVQLQPGPAPHRDGRGRWWRHVPDPHPADCPACTATVPWPVVCSREDRTRLSREGAHEPLRLPPVPVPADLEVEVREPFNPITAEHCPELCGAPMLRCEDCGALGCPCVDATCPECGSGWPHTCRAAAYPVTCSACAAERFAAVIAWAEQPLDPHDPLELLADDEQTPIRMLQEAIRQHPTYRVIVRIRDEQLREAFLVATTTGLHFDEDAAAAFFDSEICRCPAWACKCPKWFCKCPTWMFDDAPDDCTRAHREAAWCARCRVLRALEAEQFEQLMATVAAARRASRPGMCTIMGPLPYLGGGAA